MSCAITLTTINLPYVVEDYIVNILKYEHSDVEFIITGDNKTPNGIENYLNNLSNKYNIKIHYLNNAIVIFRLGTWLMFLFQHHWGHQLLLCSSN